MKEEKQQRRIGIAGLPSFYLRSDSLLSQIPHSSFHRGFIQHLPDFLIYQTVSHLSMGSFAISKSENIHALAGDAADAT